MSSHGHRFCCGLVVAKVAALDEAHEDHEARPKSRETLIRHRSDVKLMGLSASRP